MTTPSESCIQRVVFEHLYVQGVVRIIVATDWPGVVVPDEVPVHEGMMVLDYSPLFRVRIVWDDETLQADLSFQGRSFLTVVPWAAIGAMASHIVGMEVAWNLGDRPEEAHDESEEPKSGLRIVK
jgi:stringent starvation protein B